MEVSSLQRAHSASHHIAGDHWNVYLGSAELAAICSKVGHIPTKLEYLADMGVPSLASAGIYKYMNFDQMPDFIEKADTVAA